MYRGWVASNGITFILNFRTRSVGSTVETGEEAKESRLTEIMMIMMTVKSNTQRK
jgi:hypothetical protein